MERTLYDEEHEAFRESFARFVDKEVAPRYDDWERAGIADRDVWLAAGEQGYLGMMAPERFGGGGSRDFRFNAVVTEEIARRGFHGLQFALHNDVVLPYLLQASEEQQRRYLPGMVSGELVGAIAMTEPGAGSDLAGVRTTAVRDGDAYVIDGAKTFITNGILADVVVVVAKTDPAKKHKGISLLLVERDTPGFTRGRNLAKIGQKAQDTAELFFDGCRVPAENLLGEEGRGFAYLMQNLGQERLSLALAGVAAAEGVLAETLAYVKSRTAFGQPIGSFQHSRFLLAELTTDVEMNRLFTDRCVELLNAGRLSPEDAAKAKWKATELQNRVADRCVQLHGGYGYMTEYPVSRAFLDARVTTIYGGTTEIMKEIVGRSLGL